MQVERILLRIVKFLGKAILGLLIVLLIAVALLHLPSVQKLITRKLTNYLSSKIESKVEIQRINFSVLGDVAIDEVAIWDRSNSKIFSAHKIEIESHIYDLVTGDLTFDQVSLDGVDGKLIQQEDGLNIQFIIDAFKSKEKQPTTKSNPVTLQFKKVRLQNILFEFTSALSGISVDVKLGTFTTQVAELITLPFKIKADQVLLEHTTVNILSTQPPVTQTTGTAAASTNPILLSPDFGTGIIFEINNLDLNDDHVSFHKDSVTNPAKFDPSHLDLKNIQISLSDILIHEDTLAAGLDTLSFQTAGFTLTNAMADINLNPDQLFISGLHLASGKDELKADLTVPNVRSVQDADQGLIEIEVQSLINPNDFSYFFSDSMMNQFHAWGATEFVIEANHINGKGQIKKLNLTSGNSQLQVKGMVNNIFDFEKINWKDLVVEASIGSAFKSLLTPFLRTIKTPPAASFQLTSSGNLKNIFVDGEAFTTWGDVKANGKVNRLAENLGLDIRLSGNKVNLGEWLSQSWLGRMDLSVEAEGMIGDHTNIEINGLINRIELMEQPIHHIAFQSSTRNDTATVAISIEDPNYHSVIGSKISFTGPLIFTNNIQLDTFMLGRLLHKDSTLIISAGTKSKLKFSPSSLEGYLEGEHIHLHKQSKTFELDTMVIHALVSPTKSEVEYFTDYANANLVSNFDIMDAAEVIRNFAGNIIKGSNDRALITGTRTAQFNIALEDGSFIKLLGLEVDDFSSLQVTGEFDEQKQTATLQTTSGKFKGYGVSFDTLNSNLIAIRDSVGANMSAKNLSYDSIHVGNLDFDLLTKGDTSVSNLLLSNDTITLLGMRARILPTDSGAFVYTDKLKAFDNDYFIDPINSVHVGNKNITLNHFLISRDSMQISLEGDLNAFNVSLKNIDLAPLNFLLSPDTIIINKGYLTGRVSYIRNQQINLKADIDSLILYNSSPLTIDAIAVSDRNEVPFEFHLTNTTNKIDMKGQYQWSSNEVDAALLLDINNLELFDFLVADAIDEMDGAIKGAASIRGPIQKPAMNGHVRFMDVGLTTINPKLTFHVDDDSIALNNSSILLNHFTLYDKQHHPLTVDGTITSPDYQSFAYDLRINSDEYTLINNPDSTSGKIRGLLVIDSNIKLKGNEKDTNIEAKLAIKNATDLTLVTSTSDIELLKAEGIVDFVDPALLRDTVSSEPSGNFYDSLIASLPDFNLNSTITIEDNASLRLIIDEQSGDYIKAAGSADLELGYNRRGNLSLSGNYTIKKGVYRLSFYDLVKKNFNLVQGSSIVWHGSPKNGDLNIKAVHTVESNSLGLIGHEIGENEKSIYKRSLNYEVGINILGTIDKPIISFSLDLPQNEKVSYPVLANKLDRLRQPEYQSELNKQVFGLLVLGGFLPESSADVNSNVIATTALSNSVNSLLAGQLNRFASQYIKGVTIDVGIQSFSDYSAPGGKTQTAMDFRVSKSIMNDRLSFEIGGDFDINQDQSGTNTGKNYRGDIAIIYDLTGNGDKQLKLFNNETYDIIYQEIRNTGISLIFIREFASKEKRKNKDQ